MKSAVRIPRLPASTSLVALGIALIPVAYGLAVDLYRKGVRRGTSKKQK